MRIPFLSLRRSSSADAGAVESHHDADGFPLPVQTDAPRLSLKQAMRHHMVVTMYNHISDIVSEPPLVVVDDESLPLQETGAQLAQALIDKPSPRMTGRQLLGTWAADLRLLGNAFAVKRQLPVNGGTNLGATQQLLYVSPLDMKVVYKRPESGQAGFASIAGYRVSGNSSMDMTAVRPLMASEIQYQPDEVIHMTYRPALSNPLVGENILESALGLLATDQEGEIYTGVVLHNAGVTPAIVTPDEDEAPIYTQAQHAAFEAMITGARRGSISMAPARVRVERLALSPAEMMIDSYSNLPESRLAALAGLQVSLLGWLIGLENSPWSHLPTAREYEVEEAIDPDVAPHGDATDRAAVAGVHAGWTLRV